MIYTDRRELYQARLHVHKTSQPHGSQAHKHGRALLKCQCHPVPRRPCASKAPAVTKQAGKAEDAVAAEPMATLSSVADMRSQLMLYNTMGRAKQHFAPRPEKADQVQMYVCGVTVYDFSHIGHARVYVAFDVMYRLLRHLQYDVQYVRNFTDVDDK
eukprot:358308-Chlamydomonas_euryale.AAC.8